MPSPGPLPQIAQLYRVPTNIRTGGQKRVRNISQTGFANVYNIATGAGLRTHGCFWSSGSSRACTRPSHQVGGGKYPQAKIFANIHDDAGNCRKKCVKITFH